MFYVHNQIALNTINGYFVLLHTLSVLKACSFNFYYFLILFEVKGYLISKNFLYFVQYVSSYLALYQKTRVNT